ncbi:MAG: DNA polymerase, partial [Pyrinomonadaceae bacterium]
MDHDESYYVTWIDSPALVEHYAKKDAEYTLEQEYLLRPLIEEDSKLHALYRLEQKVSEVLYRAEQHGVAIDPVAVGRIDAHYREREVRARSDLETTLGGVPEGPGSEEWLREALVAAGVPLDEKTLTGKVAINKQALRLYAAHPAVKALLDWRRVRKFQTTYLDAVRDHTLVHPTFNQAQAWTGRMSGQNPNMQNLPKRSELAEENDLKVRSVFVPRPGCEFMIFDYDAIEMRVLAHFLSVPEYQEEVANGDPHAATAFAVAQILGLPGNGPDDFGKSTANRSIRDGAKQVTYSIVYGGGGPVVRDTWNREMSKIGRTDLMVDLDQARQVRRAIAGSIPGFKQLTNTPWKGRNHPSGVIHQQLMNSMVFEDTEEGRKAYGYVRTIGGRKQWISLEKAYVGLSGLMQGSAADIMKAGAVNGFDALKNTGARPL